MNDMVSGDEDSVVTVCVAVTPVATSTTMQTTIGLTTLDGPKAGKFI